ALLGAMLFAVHPMLAEPVNYVYARGTLLAALFSLLAVRAWLDEKAWLAVGWFALAMLAKEEAAAVPVVLALAWRHEGVPRGPGGPPHYYVVRKPLAAMFGIALALGLRTVWAASIVKGSQAGSQAGISPQDYFAVQGVVIWRYLRM